jgi:hypothetical protein
LGGKFDRSREGEGFRAIENVERERANTAIEGFADIYGSIDWMHAVDVQKEICGDVDVCLLLE